MIRSRVSGLWDQGVEFGGRGLGVWDSGLGVGGSGFGAKWLRIEGLERTLGGRA